MNDYSQILGSTDYIHFIPRSKYSKYKFIISDPAIQYGKPTIKGTRVVASEIFIAQLEGLTLNQLILDYKEIGVELTKEKLMEAFDFTLDSVQEYINGKKASKRAK